MSERDDSAYCAELARRADPDRALAALFAPPDRRAALFALYAFNVEVAKTREVVTEPLLGEIRLTWWRETIDGIYAGAPRSHAVATALAGAVQRFDLSREHFERLIEGRALDLGDAPPEDMAALVGYAAATSSTLTALALEILGARREPAEMAGRDVGVAWALVGLLRAAGFHARARRQYLPAGMMREAGADPADLMARRATPAIARVAARLADAARAHLASARAVRDEVPRAALPALLPATLADAYLRRLAAADYDVLGEPIAMGRTARLARLAWSAWRGRY